MCKNTYTNFLGSRTVSPVVVQMNDLANVLNLLQEHGGIGVQDAVPAGMAPIDAVHAGAVPAGPIPAVAVAAAPDAVPAGRARGLARGRGQARGRGNGRARGRGRARPDNAADAQAMKVAKLANQILMLKLIRRIGGPEVAMPCVLEDAVAFCKLGGTSNARSSKTKLTISQAEVERWTICSQMVLESGQRPEEKGHGNDGQMQLSCGPGFQMKTQVAGR